MPEREIPLFPLRLVLSPGMPLPLHIFEDRYKLMIGTCMVTDQTFGVALIRSGPEVGVRRDLHRWNDGSDRGLERLPEGRMNLMAVGVERFRVLERIKGQPYAGSSD